MPYEKQTWSTGDKITAAKLNHLEDGLADVTQLGYRKPAYDTASGVITVNSSAAVANADYLYTSSIELKAGETLRFYAAGSTGAWMLSQWTADGTFVQGLIRGDGLYHITDYTAEADMFVRISGKILCTTSTLPAVSQDDFDSAIIITDRARYYGRVKCHPLYRKKIALLGDSVAYGNQLGPDATWLHLLALKYDMTEHNHGLNGSSVAETGDGNGMVSRAANLEQADYVVVTGGNNDYRLNVPLGDLASTDPADFSGAVNNIITTIRAAMPKAKLLFMGPLPRYSGANAVGCTEEDYSDRIQELCGIKCVPFFDNFHCSGLFFKSSSLRAWMDEGISLGQEASYHLSAEAYRWVLPKYESLLL